MIEQRRGLFVGQFPFAEQVHRRAEHRAALLRSDWLRPKLPEVRVDWDDGGHGNLLPFGIM